MSVITIHVSKIASTLWEVSNAAVRLDIQQMALGAMVSSEYSLYVSYLSNHALIPYIIDINECHTGNSCEDICINTDGAYECSCSDNSEIVMEDGSCVGNDEMTIATVLCHLQLKLFLLYRL